MATTNILELRQADSNLVITNGDYETLLSNDITLENGDVLVLKNAFIDTKQTGNIVLDTDTTLTIQFTPYITDWLETEDKGYYYKKDNSPTTIDFANGFDFIPYYNIIDGPLEGYELVTSVNYETLMPGPHPDSIQTTYSYINIVNQTIVFHTTIYANTLPPEYGTYKDVFSNIIAKIGSFKLLTTEDTLNQLGLSYNSPAITVIPNVIQTSYNPYIFTISIVIPAGNYSPTYLSLLISEKLSQNGSNNSIPFAGGLLQSPFIKSAYVYDSGRPMPNGAKNPNGTPIIITEQAKFISTDASLVFNFLEGKYYLIGSSQIALEFDSDSNKFVFEFLHMPMYDNVTGTNISVRYQYYANNPAEAITATAKNGGIFLTGLLATDVNGNTIDFWSNTLGFNIGSICINPHNGYVEDILGLTGFVQTIGPITHGINATTGFFGIDTIVYKNKSSFWNQPILSSFDDKTLCSTINNTVAIEASFSIDDLLNKYSHYIIQTDITLSNNLIGTETYHNINGIISKYYSDNNYTFGDESGAIQYQHKGQPVFIKSIKVRILSSDKTIDPELGSDNTIFMQIIKQPLVKGVKN
jgi:hypothetical protein